MPLNLRSRKQCVFLCVALGSIFLIPMRVSTVPSISDSYTFGYNNRAGTVLLIVFLLLSTFFFRSDVQEAVTDGAIPRSLFIRWMLIFATAWAVMTAFTHGFGGFGESAYLIDRLELLAKGRVPYRDFEFAYGAAFLYVPRLFMLLHLTAETSYAVFWLLTLTAGVWLLLQTLRMIRFKSKSKADIFSLICMFSLISVPMTGTNYTLFRFLPSCYLGLVSDRIYRRSGTSNRPMAYASVLGSTIVLLLISPETAVAFAIGSIGYYLLIEKSRSVQVVIQQLALVTALVGTFMATDRLGVFYTLKIFSDGAYNFPIVPAGHILLFFFMCLVVTLHVAEFLRSRREDDPLLAVIAVSALTVFAALGRCDPGHIGFASIGVVIAASLLVSNTRHWQFYRRCFVVFFLILPAASILWLYKGLLRTSLSAPRHVKALALQAPAEAPFGYSPNRLGTSQDGVDTGYFDGLDNAFTRGAIDRKISELSDAPHLVLPQDFRMRCMYSPQAERKLIRSLFVFPYFAQVKRVPAIWQPLCKSIGEHYQKSRDLDYGYELWDAK